MDGTGGLLVNALSWHVRKLGLSLSWIQFFSVNCTGVKRTIFVNNTLAQENTINTEVAIKAMLSTDPSVKNFV